MENIAILAINSINKPLPYTHLTSMDSRVSCETATTPPLAKTTYNL